MKSKKNRFNMLYGALLIVFTLYVVLDTFLIPRSYVVAADDGSNEIAVVSESVTVSGADDDASAGTSTGMRTSTGTGMSTSTGTGTSTSTGTGTGLGSTWVIGGGGDEVGNSETSEEKVEEPTEDEDVNMESDDVGSEETAESATGSASETTITMNEYRYLDTTIYVADVILGESDSIKTAFAYDTYGKNVKAETSEIAADNGATLAINGDFYGSKERGYVIRNGVLYRSTSAGNEDLVIYADGSFEIITEGEVSAEELLENGAMQVLSFGPGLVIDGEIAVTQGEEVGKAKASNPRTAIGIIDDNHYVFVVSDGRTDASEGLSLYELAEFMSGLGVETAYNLDGGGSSTMVYQGEVVNITTSGRSNDERSVSDIVYI